MRKNIIYPFVIVLIAGISISVFSQESAQNAQSVDSFIARIEGVQDKDAEGDGSLTLSQLMEKYHVPGVSIAVIKDFDIHWAKGYGIADVDTGAKVDTETLFQAASISKPVNAMAMLKMVQDGKFGLDDNINSILLSWQVPPSEFTAKQPVTPRAIASHTAGFGDGFGFPGYNPGEPLPTTVQIIKGEKPSNRGPVQLVRPPLAAFQYSGGGVTILQLALTDIAKKPYAELLQETVLDPIGMTVSTFEQPLSPERDKNAARGHNQTGESMGPKWHVYPEYAAAGLWTTPTDLAKFAIEVQKSYHGESNKVLSKEMVSEMLSPVGVGQYAVGFSIGKMGEGWYFSHGGGNWGFVCGLVAHKVKGYGFVVMTNSFSGGRIIQQLNKRMEAAYRYDSLDKPVPR